LPRSPSKVIDVTSADRYQPVTSLAPPSDTD